ncbi:hypothetical protein Mapa_010760 [Marchantia paleacea]|nr:hypothetical protein Mapa_010760 [Marchantia paleacea]
MLKETALNLPMLLKICDSLTAMRTSTLLHEACCRPAHHTILASAHGWPKAQHPWLPLRQVEVTASGHRMRYAYGLKYLNDYRTTSSLLQQSARSRSSETHDSAAVFVRQDCTDCGLYKLSPGSGEKCGASTHAFYHTCIRTA